jgi:hypothetical protein
VYIPLSVCVYVHTVLIYVLKCIHIYMYLHVYTCVDMDILIMMIVKRDVVVKMFNSLDR